MRNDNLDTLGAVLNATYDDLLHKSKDTSSYDPEFVGNEEDIDRENFEALKSYYDSCMNENVIDGLGPTPIFKDILNLTTLFKYSTFMDDEPFDIRKITHFTDIIKHLAENGVPSIMSVNIEPDERHPEINSISLSQPRLGLPSREYFNQTEILDTYKEGLNNVLNAIYGEETDGTSTNEFRLEKLKENNLPTLNKEVIARMVDRFIAFEKKLADITLPKFV